MSLHFLWYDIDAKLCKTLSLAARSTTSIIFIFLLSPALAIQMSSLMQMLKHCVAGLERLVTNATRGHTMILLRKFWLLDFWCDLLFIT
jgi:hypothetical protein